LLENINLLLKSLFKNRNQIMFSICIILIF
jgi:hypothetical protein